MLVHPRQRYHRSQTLTELTVLVCVINLHHRRRRRWCRLYRRWAYCSRNESLCNHLEVKNRNRRRSPCRCGRST